MVLISMKKTVLLTFALLISTLILMPQVAFCLVGSGPSAPPAGTGAVVSDNIGAKAWSEVVFIDAGIPDADDFFKHLPADLPTYVIGSRENGVDSILSVLSGLESVDAIHIVSHGNDGMITLGSTALFAEPEMLESYDALLADDQDFSGVGTGAYGASAVFGFLHPLGRRQRQPEGGDGEHFGLPRQRQPSCLR